MKIPQPHPATQILVWACLAIVVQILPPAWLLAVACLLLLLAVKIHIRRLFTLLRRTRWIFFSLLLIYAFATPGEALWVSDYAPTREGLREGLFQLGRIACVLAALSILLTLLKREQLISGLYTLAYPVRYLGLSRERLAVRLALTLHYAENAMRDTASDWRGAIRQACSGQSLDTAHISLSRHPLGWIDFGLLLAGTALLIGVGL
jgi:energy-coupling factor transport system permease protein